MFMSAPSLVWSAAYRPFSSEEIYNDLYVSGIGFVRGHFHSIAVGIPFGIAVGWYKEMSSVVDSFINAMNAAPRVTVLPLIIIWLGIGIPSKIGINFLGGVFSMLINARDAVKTAY